jgi:hybrid cluster-associated redox disulfide protein
MDKFNADMSVGEAMQGHPRAREVFAGFHLGGCSHCAISEFETIRQICEGYGVPVEMLLGALNSLESPEPVSQA